MRGQFVTAISFHFDEPSVIKENDTSGFPWQPPTSGVELDRGRLCQG